MSHVADALSLARALLALPLVWALVSDAPVTALWALGRLPVWLPLVATLMLARFFLTSPTSSGLRYDSIGRHYGSMLYAVLAVWLLGASDPAKQAALVVVAIVTAVALVGRTRCLRPATR